MDSYMIGDSVIIANTMISVFQKENRRIIDDIDIKNYREVTEKFFNAKNVYLDVDTCSYEEISNYLADYMVPIGEDGLPFSRYSMYALMPWSTLDEMREHFRVNFPIDAMFGYFEEEISSLMPERGQQDIDGLTEIYSKFLQHLEEQTNSEIEEVQDKIAVLQKRAGSIRAIRGLLK